MDIHNILVEYKTHGVEDKINDAENNRKIFNKMGWQEWRKPAPDIKNLSVDSSKHSRLHVLLSKIDANKSVKVNKKTSSGENLVTNMRIGELHYSGKLPEGHANAESYLRHINAKINAHTKVNPEAKYGSLKSLEVDSKHDEFLKLNAALNKFSFTRRGDTSGRRFKLDELHKDADFAGGKTDGRDHEKRQVRIINDAIASHKKDNNDSADKHGNIEVHINGMKYKVHHAAMVDGTKKADIVLQNHKGENVVFISHKHATDAGGMRQFSGLAADGVSSIGKHGYARSDVSSNGEISNNSTSHKEVHSFIKDSQNYIKNNPGDHSGLRFGRPIKDPQLKKIAMYGKDYHDKHKYTLNQSSNVHESAPMGHSLENVSHIMVGETTAHSSGKILKLGSTTHIMNNGEEHHDKSWEPTLMYHHAPSRGQLGTRGRFSISTFKGSKKASASVLTDPKGV